jgi:hypothetical protein
METRKTLKLSLLDLQCTMVLIGTSRLVITTDHQDISVRCLDHIRRVRAF